MAATKFYDLQQLIAYGSGKWEHFFSTQCGIDPDLLTGTECSCPWCGGNTRFRLIDRHKGALFCSHCFNRDNGDVFAAVQKCLGISFTDAVEKVANYLGVAPLDRPPNSKRVAVDPAKDLQFQEWTAGNEMFARDWCKTKPPVTLEAVKRIGGRFARYKKQFNVIAFPVWGEKFEQAQPVGWIIYNASGSTLPKWNPQTKANEWVKVKLTHGSEAGILGDLLAIREAQEVWKVEGVPDLLAFLSLPDVPAGVTALTNANGCGERAKPFMVELFKGKTARVCHDCDQPGQKGAVGFLNEKTKRFHDGWCQSLASVASNCKNVLLPFSIEETHGKDFRDWVNKGGNWWSLQKLVEAGADFQNQGGTTTQLEGGIDFDARRLSNFTIELDDEGKEKTVALAMVAVLGKINQITDNWPRRVGGNLFVHDESGVHWLENTSALFGWLSSRCGVVDWGRNIGCVTKDEVFYELTRTAKQYCSVETLPHFPPLPDHYYACKNYESGDGEAITKLLSFFNPESKADEDLILALFATPFWGGKPGSRPAFLITSDAGRGVGKSKITDMVSHLLYGCIELSSNEDAGRMRSRLLSPEGLKARLARLDNVKTLRFSWAELESVITAPQISGHKLHTGEANRPNNLMWLITLNGASLSTDMAQRVIIIKLKRPRRVACWESDVVSFIDQNRDAIISDIKAFFEIEPEPVPDHSRWAAWEDQVVGRLAEPEAVKQAIKERSVISDVEAEEMELVEAGFESRLLRLGYAPYDGVFIPSGIAAKWFNEITGEKKHVIGACRVISQYCLEGGMKRLEKPTDTALRGFCFFGEGYNKNSNFYKDIEQRIENSENGNSQRSFF